MIHVGVVVGAVNKGLGQSKMLLNEAQIASAEKVCLSMNSFVLGFPTPTY